MVKTKKLFFTTILALAILIGITSCKDSSNNDSMGDGYLTKYSDCKPKSINRTENPIVKVNQSLNFTYTESNRTLSLKHVDTLLNCAPGDIYAEISMDGTRIEIQEKEKELGEHCLCLYDTDYNFINIGVDTYTITFKSKHPDAAIFILDLKKGEHTGTLLPTSSL